MAKDAVEGSYFVNHLDYDDPEVQDFKTRYKAKYGKDVELNGYLVHDAVLMLVDAIQRAGEANSEKIAQALETTDIKGITGKIKIGKNTHNPEGKDAAIIKIIDGKYVFQQKYSAE
jgi:branched-chain amino acid transport system substrate-binding protein